MVIKRSKKFVSAFLVVCLLLSFISEEIKADDINSYIDSASVWRMKDSKGQYLDGSGMVVAVIDSGVDYTHPDLGGGFGTGYKVIGGYDFGDNDPDPIDKYGHGTSDAGIISANGKVKGIAPNAKILAYKVSQDKTNNSSIDAIIKAMESAINAKADVIIVDMYINNSSIEQKRALSELVDKAFSLGIPVISGAGNFGSNLVDKDTLIPSMSDSFSFANNISVGAFDVMKDMIAPYSSIGPSRFLDSYFSNQILLHQRMFIRHKLVADMIYLAGLLLPLPLLLVALL